MLKISIKLFSVFSVFLSGNEFKCNHKYGKWLPYCDKGIKVEFKRSCRKCGECEVRIEE